MLSGLVDLYIFLRFMIKRWHEIWNFNELRTGMPMPCRTWIASVSGIFRPTVSGDCFFFGALFCLDSDPAANIFVVSSFFVNFMKWIQSDFQKHVNQRTVSLVGIPKRTCQVMWNPRRRWEPKTMMCQHGCLMFLQYFSVKLVSKLIHCAAIPYHRLSLDYIG